MEILIRVSLFTLLFAAWSCQSISPAPSLPNEDVCGQEALHEAVKEARSKLKSGVDSLFIVMQILAEATSNCSPGSFADTLADLCRLAGNQYWGKDYDLARRYYQKGLSFRPGGLILGKLYSNIGYAHYDEENYFLALVYFDSAIAVRPAYPEDLYYKNAVARTGDAYLKIGQYYLAEQYFEKALDMALKNGSPGEMARACEMMSNCRRGLGQFREAIEIGQKGIDVLESCRALSPSDSSTLANCYQNQGNAWQEYMSGYTKKPTEWGEAGKNALNCYKNAHAIHKRLTNKTSQENLKIILLNMGELHRRMGNYGQSVEILSQVISTYAPEIEKSVPDRHLLGMLHINRGEAFMDAGDFDAAASDFDAALYYLAPAYAIENNPISFEAGGPTASPILVNMALHDNALLAVKKGRAEGGDSYVRALDGALARYDDLAAFTNNARSYYLTEADKAGLTLKVRPYLDSAFFFCLEQERLTRDEQYLRKAFEITEQSKAMSLLETRQSKRYRAGLSSEQMQDYKALAQEQAFITDATFQNRNDPEKLKELKQQWLEHLGRWRSFQKSLAPSSGEPDGIKAISVEDIQKYLLDDDQAILTYHEVGSTLFVFMIGKEAFHMIPVGIDDSYYENLQHFFRLGSSKEIAPYASVQEKREAFATVGKRLYDYLLPLSLRDYLPERLLVIPNDRLQNIPFEALWTLDETVPITARKQENYLISKHAVAYAPSASLLWDMRRSRSLAKKTAQMAVFAPDFSETHSASASASLSRIERDAIKDIRFDYLPTREEARRIGKEVAVRKFIGKDACKRNFWEVSPRVQVIHFFTHGVLYHEDPRFNFVSFSQMADSVGTDELLFMHELYNRPAPLNLEFVGLTGCNTARGSAMESEGDFSMARGLAAAGVKSFAVSLWETGGQVSTEIMPDFYKELVRKKGLSKDVAMQRAKLAYLSDPDNFDPHSWAPIILIGDPAPIALTPAGVGLKRLLAVIMVVAVVQLIFRRGLPLKAKKA